MAGPKQSSSLTAKKPKAKAVKPATATKLSLSSEFVVDSDESEDAEARKVEKPALKTTKSKPTSAKPAIPKPSTSQAKPSKKRKSPSPTPAGDDSSSSGSGTDSSTQEEKRPSKKKVLVAQDGSPVPKPKSATARPVSAKPTGKPSTNVKPLDRKTDPKPGTTRDDSTSETRESSEDSGSGSDNRSESESESGSSDKTSLQSPRKGSPVRKSVPQQRAPGYEPPAGFEPTSISLHPASKLSEILAPSNLQSKQIWHITAPDLVPISLVKETSTQNIGNGAPILEYHGAKYGLVPESEVEQASRRALLLPSTETNDYRSSKTRVIKTLHLQQLVSLPNHALNPAIHPNRSASASDLFKKMPRQQPEGLRMRYRPFGAPDDSDLEPTHETMPKAPDFRIPDPVKESSPRRKRKRHESDDGSSNTTSAVKSKKLKQSLQATGGAIEDPMDIDAISDKRSNEAQSPITSPRLKTNGVRSNGDLLNGNETKEERKKRREKKRLEQRSSPLKPATALPLDLKRGTETMQPGEVVEGAAPAVANAVEGTQSTNGIPPPAESKDEKAKRKEERRRLKELAEASKGASLMSAGDAPRTKAADSPDQMMQEIENAQRDASIPVSTSRGGSPQTQTQKESRTARATGNLNPDSSRSTQRDGTKEERAKRKEEKRRRRMERGSA